MYVCETSGVPQGTILGPVLLLLCINDLPENMKNSMVCLFADDCILYRAIRSLDDCNELQDDLLNLEQWETKWLMKFNETKCYVMTVSLANKYKMLHNYILHITFLPAVNHLKYLGVTLQSNLKWDIHVPSIVSKASQILGFLRRNFKSVPLKI